MPVQQGCQMSRWILSLLGVEGDQILFPPPWEFVVGSGLLAQKTKHCCDFYWFTLSFGACKWGWCLLSWEQHSFTETRKGFLHPFIQGEEGFPLSSAEKWDTVLGQKQDSDLTTKKEPNVGAGGLPGGIWLKSFSEKKGHIQEEIVTSKTFAGWKFSPIKVIVNFTITSKEKRLVCPFWSKSLNWSESMSHTDQPRSFVLPSPSPIGHPSPSNAYFCTHSAVLKYAFTCLAC